MRNSEATSYLNLVENIVYGIRRVLTKDLVDSIYYDNINKYKKSRQTIFVLKSNLYGHSQHSVEALYHLLKGRIPFILKPMHANDMYNNGYWWIELNGVIIDCTYGCYKDINQYPYNTGLKSNIQLSKKGRIVIERVMEVEKEKVDNRWHTSKFELAKIFGV